MARNRPHVVVIGGPNGAGKSTASPFLLRDKLAVTEFVNADVIAQGLSGFDPAGSAVAAGRVMLRRLEELAQKRVDFAFESTLASRTTTKWLLDLKKAGYRVRLVFLWLETPELAMARVNERVRGGGHDVPDDTIRRRYERGLNNFFALYRPLAECWRFYDNSGSHPKLIAMGGRNVDEEVFDAKQWQLVQSRR